MEAAGVPTVSDERITVDPKWRVEAQSDHPAREFGLFGHHRVDRGALDDSRSWPQKREQETTHVLPGRRDSR